MVSVIHRAQLVVLQQFGEFARIHAIILIAFFQQSISPRIANYQFADVGLQQVVQPGGPGSFLEGDVHLSTQPINKLQDHTGFGLDDTFTILPAEFRTAIEMLSLCTSIPIYLLLLVIKGCAPFRMVCRTTKPYTKRGHPFIMRISPTTVSLPSV